jgi:nicotinamide-nucleotide amidase
MEIELLTIGTELLLGFTIDTNGAVLGQALAEAGLTVTRRVTVPDQAGAIAEAARGALARTGAFVSTGGLGPTADDVTKKVVADLFSAPLTFRPEIWDALVARFARFGRVPPERNRGQAEVPEGATILPNRWGTAPGLWLEGPPGLAILLPGVPGEMRGLLVQEVVPRLTSRSGGKVVCSRTVRTTAIPESSLADRLGNAEAEVAPLSLAYLPSLDGVDLRLTAWGQAPGEAAAALQRAVELVRGRAGEWAYGEDTDDLAAIVLQEARERHLTLATAESCTGGGFGARLTSIPGSSDVFLGGVIAYDNRLKREELAVPESLLAEHGAVSEAVVRAMAEGAARRLRADLVVAVTGIAGPGGGTPDKPVGLVYLATLAAATTIVTRQVVAGDRGEVRGRTVQLGLYQLLRRLQAMPRPPT